MFVVAAPHESAAAADTSRGRHRNNLPPRQVPGGLAAAGLQLTTGPQGCRSDT